MASESIKHARDCGACGATTYQFERCHRCGDIPWVDDRQVATDGGRGVNQQSRGQTGTVLVNAGAGGGEP